MARGNKEARAAAQSDEASVEQPLGVALAEAVAIAPIGPVHGALGAIETALIELKARARSGDDLLRAEHASLLDRILSL